jgi:hypothetical protein
MKNGKSPGTDGLTVEFYKYSFNDIAEIMVRSFNYSFATKQMSPEQRRGIIKLIPKPNKDKKLLKLETDLLIINLLQKH